MSRRHVRAALAATASVIILTASAGDDALPAGQGDPRFFHFSAPVTLTVTYG